jgi:hypothetical protein
MTTITHACAENDINGNPQRLYLLTDDAGAILASWDEGYLGHHAVPGPWRREAYDALRSEISTDSYHWILANTLTPTGRMRFRATVTSGTGPWPPEGGEGGFPLLGPLADEGCAPGL